MDIFFFLIFCLGLIIGSFLNCVIYRLEEGEKSFLKGRSFCPKCKHTLSWQDLIPVFSFFFLKGKCRYCSQKISWQYPLVELATATLFLLTARYYLPFDLNNIIFSDFIILFFLLIFISLLIIIFAFDLRHYIIPDRVIYPAILIGIVYNIVYSLLINNNTALLINYFLSGLFASLFFLFIVLISKGRWMGLGDVKLAFFMGLVLGSPNIIIALFLSFLIGALVGISLILAQKKKFSSEIPFAPFLILGTFLALFWGGDILSFYLSLFLVK